METDPIRALTIKEFLQRYGIGQTKFHEEVKSGRLTVRRMGRRVLIARDDAENWLRSLPAFDPQEAA